MSQKNLTELFHLSMGEPSESPLSFRFHRPEKRAARFGAVAAMVCALGLLLAPAGETAADRLQPIQPPHKVRVTAYTNVPGCTDSTPNETASLLRIRRHHYGKIVALSRDLARQYKFGDKFELRVNGQTHVVEFQDLMAKRHRNSIDLLLPSVRKSQRFGVNEGVLVPLERSAENTARRTG